jgi:hypothetical protein
VRIFVDNSGNVLGHLFLYPVAIRFVCTFVFTDDLLVVEADDLDIVGFCVTFCEVEDGEVASTLLLLSLVDLLKSVSFHSTLDTSRFEPGTEDDVSPLILTTIIAIPAR